MQRGKRLESVEEGGRFPRLVDVGSSKGDVDGLELECLERR